MLAKIRSYAELQSIEEPIQVLVKAGTPSLPSRRVVA
jgi:hypothetical protein